MADEPVIIVDAKGTEHEFPAGFDPQRAAAIVRGQSQTPQSDSGGLALAAVGNGIPAAARAATAFAESPTAAKTIGAVARGATTVGAIVHGIATANPAQVLAASNEGWAAGKGGYFLGKGMQSVAAPVGKLLGKAAPYAQSLSTLGGASGVGDLAQMAEPQRKDIGFLGVGPSQNVPGAEPPWLNAVLGRLYGRFTGAK